MFLASCHTRGIPSRLCASAHLLSPPIFERMSIQSGRSCESRGIRYGHNDDDQRVGSAVRIDHCRQRAGSITATRERELGARMSEPESITQVQPGAIKNKSGKGKAIIKRSKTEAPSRQSEASVGSPDSADRPRETRATGAVDRRDPGIVARIQQRAYVLFEASGCEHGHELEHWLEAERQITGASDRSQQ